MNIELIECLQKLTENMQQMNERINHLENNNSNDSQLPHDLEKISSTLKGIELSIRNRAYEL